MCSSQASQNDFIAVLATDCWISVFISATASNTGAKTRPKQSHKLLIKNSKNIISRVNYYSYKHKYKFITQTYIFMNRPFSVFFL